MILHPDEWWREFRRRLRRWYAKHARSLPWRATEDPYAIWVSEIMLQQTQVATVERYYARFLSLFPDVHHLAAADEQAVLKAWEGLGYYRRARQMHQAAKAMVAQWHGVFPTHFNDVLNLPGIGRYTAGAICSFAFNQRQPIVEANTQRLYARLLRLTQSLTVADSQAKLWSFAEQILPARDPRWINQAVMEVGSLVCQPKPLCDQCPLTDLCPTFRDKLQSVIPAAKKKTNYELRKEVVVLIRDQRQRYLIRQRGENEWWSGLWDFPRVEEGTLGLTSNENRKADPCSRIGSRIQLEDCSFELGNYLFRIQHAVTKYRIQLDVFQADRRSKVSRKLLRTYRWASPSELIDLPLSSSGRRIVDRMVKRNVIK
jgi:A/G-specific adenine glycosylase